MLGNFIAVAAMALTISLPSLNHASPLPTLVKRTAADIILNCTVPNSFAVTFDDGPSIWTHELLDYLGNKSIKVTFFVNGQNYNDILDPQIAAVVKRAHAEGHQIGSHTWSHADISQSSTDLASEMSKLDDALKNLIGVRPIYMRPPYGNTSPQALEYLGSQGYKVINWNVDTDDWQHPLDFKRNLQAYRTILMNPAASGKSFISLQHDAERGTAEVFSKLAIEYVLSKGYNIMPVGTCLGDTTGWYR